MKRLLAIVLLLIPFVGIAQQKYDFKKDDWFVEGGLRYGRFLPFEQDDQYLWKCGLYSLDLRFGRQTNGRNAWERDYRHPRYGLGMRLEYYDGKLNTSDRLGGNMAVFLYFSDNIWSNKYVGFDLGLLGGLAMWTRCDDYAPDLQTNKFIGTHLNCHLSLELGANFRVSESSDIYIRGIYSHSSNAGFRLPDAGVNALSGSLGLRYHLYDRAVTATPDEELPREKVYKHYIYISDGPGATESYADRKLWFGNTFEVGYTWRLHPKFGIGAGFNYMINMENKACLEQFKRNNPWCTQEWNFFRDATNLGAFVSLDIFINRLNIHGAFGRCFYMGAIKDDYNYLPVGFQKNYKRFGFRVFLGEKRRLFVGMMMKLHAFRLDYAEWTFGYNIFQR